MKVVLLAGGLGTRLAEETGTRPKPMVGVGGRPILWHLMKYYASFGHNEFLVALGYKADVIKDYFLDYSMLSTPELTIELRSGRVSTAGDAPEDWLVHLVDTGAETMTGGRLARLRAHVSDGTFMLSYGDGLSNVNLDVLLDFHRSHGKLATVTAVRPPARFGELHMDGDRVVEFSEKPMAGEGWINGGFFVFEKRAFDRLQPHDNVPLETSVLETLAAEGELAVYEHRGFWQSMDTFREMQLLNEMWEYDRAPWNLWKECRLSA